MSKENARWQMNAKTKKFLSLSLQIFVLLLLISFGLPAILLFLNIPSFSIGNGWLTLLKWKNDASGSGIDVRLVPLAAIGFLLGFLATRRIQNSNSETRKTENRRK